MNLISTRPDPDQLLARVKVEEESAHRGKLKIFLGYAAGVGKTYAMLEAAHQRKDQGVDVVVGLIETHARTETEELLQGLEVVSRKLIDYRGVVLTEPDVDAIVIRHPQLILIDELAHTNAPGSRHSKRYQDVDEILNAGIDVYTTLNIQHLESLNDVVAKITGVIVRETIPDRVIDEANELELIDLPPDELLQRLRDGKVYVPDQAKQATEKFFRKGNLTALREMTMRRAAERVDDQMRAYMQTRSITGPWAAAERLLVCISSSPAGEKLVRAARRLADELNAEWFALNIETPGLESSSDRRDQIARTLRLAEELGARSFVLPASASVNVISQAIVDFAHKNNITKIIVGKPLRPYWQEILRGSLVDRLVHGVVDIDIYVVTSSPNEIVKRNIDQIQQHSSFIRYIWSLVLIAGATGASSLISREISPTNLVMVYLVAVILAAVYLGRGPAMLASLLGVLAFDFFFVPPFLTFSVSDTEYILTFIGLFLVGTVISYLTAQAREQAESAKRRQADTAALYSLSRDLAAVEDVKAVSEALKAHIEPEFGKEIVVYLPEGNSLRAIGKPMPPSDESDLGIATWTLQHGEAAGFGTDTLAASEARYIPLRTSTRTEGVMRLKPIVAGRQISLNQRRLLEAFASQAAQAIARIRLAEQNRQVRLLQAAEKLQNALLNSLSHDLRTPLVSITGALTTLETESRDLGETARQRLIQTAREEADRLNRLVGNLLDMTRLEAGALNIKREPCDVQEVIGAAVGQMEEKIAGRKVDIEVGENFPLVTLDFVLIVHVIHNLLDNALKYSPANSPLTITARLQDDEAWITVADQGIGIPESDLERIFDKFYRVQRPEQVSGTGLGLAICKGIVEAHGGRIWAANRPVRGSIITIALPLANHP